MSDDTHPQTNYVAIWGVLTVALVVSLALGMLAPSPLVITLIFAIAAMKAYLVLAYFVHFTVEPRFVKIMVGSLVVLLAILFVGLVPDILLAFGVPAGG